MPRSGGESDKLGNRYECIWTVDSLLDVLNGKAIGVTVESFGEEGIGVEFVKELSNGIREYHSAKRQTTGNLWSLNELTKMDIQGRSKLGDLLKKLEGRSNTIAVFVSGTTANDLNELCERAERSQSHEAFEQQLESSPTLRKDFGRYILQPVFKSNLASAYDALLRIRVDGGPERRLITTVEQRICDNIYRPDGKEFEPVEVRLLLGEMLNSWFGQPISRDDVLQWLTQYGYAERDWSRDPYVHKQVEAREQSYLSHVEKELITDRPIERSEAHDAFDALRNGMKNRVVIMGAAGLGKSCTTAQTFRLLKEARIPALPVRLDIQAHALTARQLGHELDLPESPAVVLAGMAQGGECVLVIDQLDALSFASGRNQRLWDAFDEILLQTQRYPNMRLLLVCRVFDAEHDPRLRRIIADKERVETILLKPLELDKVRAVLAAKSISISLGNQAMELLQLPLNLSLFLQGDPASQQSFSSQEDLLNRYWDHKRELAGRDVKWMEVIKRLSDWLSDQQNRTLSAPLDVLDNEYPVDAAALCSLNVLIKEGKHYRFFHETFFDYCWARIFVSNGQRPLDLLLGGEQHLFRRAQVRQVLAYKRSTRVEQYFHDLSDLLAHGGVRFHLKKLIVDWLRTLPNPVEQEWALIESAHPLGDRAHGGEVLWRSVPWFDLLLSLGTWRSWLQSADEAVVRRAVWLLAMPEILRARSREVADLFIFCVSGELPWKPQYLGVFQFGEVFHAREFFDFLLWVIRNGHFDEKADRHWMTFHDLPDKNAAYAAELLGAMFQHYGALEDDDSATSSGLSPDFAIRTSEKDPLTFLRNILPDLARRLTRPDYEAASFGYVVTSRMMQRNQFGDVESSMVPAIGHAMERLAKENPDELDRLTQALEQIDHGEATALLLRAWTQNASVYADRIVTYLLGDPARFDSGYLSWGSGNGTAAISREATRVAAPLCSLEKFIALEQAILNFVTEYEREKPKFLGYHSLLLLECLPLARMTHDGCIRFKELKRRFPWEKFEPPTAFEASFVPSPIARSAIVKMTDKQWLNAMLKYSRDRSGTYDGYRKGGIHQLRGELTRAAQVEKKRFANLALRMDHTFKAEYLSAILNGVVNESKSGNSEDELPQSAVEALDVQTMESLILHIHSMPEAEFGKDICWSIKHIADRKPSSAMLSIVSHHAINDPDPEKETWQEEQGGKPLWGGDPHFQGMNSVRGAAAEAIAALLFKDHDHFSSLEPAILSLLYDPSTAVRACAVLVLTASLNINRILAVDRFLELCSGHEALLGTRYVEQFLYHGCYDQYAKLRPLMLRMLTFPDDKEAREIAAGQITIASFHDSLATEDLPQVFSADAVCRKAAAGIYARNLGNVRVSEICRENVVPFFDDPDKEVRAAAASCFRNLSEDKLTTEQALMYRFIDSPACLENSHDLISALEKSVLALPEVVCRLPERLIEDQRAYTGNENIEARRWTYRLPSLIARLYEQTLENSVKTRCLDIIDAMLELGFSEIESELQKVER